MRSAYISIVIAVQVASEAASSSAGVRALIGAALLLGLVDDQTVLADLDLVLVALAPAGDGTLHQVPLLPSNICWFGSSANRARAKARSEARFR